MSNNTTNQTPKKEPSKTLIYVSNLPFDTNDEQFRDLFKGFNLKTAYVARRKNGKSKGFGFVNLEKESDQNAAIEKVNGSDFNSRKLIARVAMNDERRNEKGELKEEFKTQQNTSTPSETVVYVSNLEWSVKDEDLKKIFADFNPKVATVATRRNGRSKGFGFVEFNNKEDQEKALKLDNQKIGGREIIVKASTGYRGDNQNNNNNNNNQREKRLNVVKRTNYTLYISNLPLELDENDLRDVFAEFNPKSSRIVSRNGNSRGYGFVEFSNSKDQGDAQNALDQSEINGRVVTVKFSTNSNNNNRRGNQRRNNNNRNYNNNNNNNYNNNNRRYNDNNNRRNNNRGGNNNNNRNYNNNNNNNNNRRNNNNNDKPKEVSTNMVYVSNLPFSVDDKGLEEIFKGLKISKAYVARRRNGYSKGFGFVELATPEDQQKALKYHNNEVSGRAIVVQAAFKVENRTN